MFFEGFSWGLLHFLLLVICERKFLRWKQCQDRQVLRIELTFTRKGGRLDVLRCNALSITTLKPTIKNLSIIIELEYVWETVYILWRKKVFNILLDTSPISLCLFNPLVELSSIINKLFQEVQKILTSPFHSNYLLE